MKVDLEGLHPDPERSGSERVLRESFEFIIEPFPLFREFGASFIPPIRTVYPYLWFGGGFDEKSCLSGGVLKDLGELCRVDVRIVVKGFLIWKRG